MATAKIGKVISRHQNFGWDACGYTIMVCDGDVHYEIDDGHTAIAKQCRDCNCEKAFIMDKEIIIGNQTYRLHV